MTVHCLCIMHIDERVSQCINYIRVHVVVCSTLGLIIDARCVYVMYLSWGKPVYCAVSECYAVSDWAVNMRCHKQVVFGRRKALAVQLSAYLGKRYALLTPVYIHANRMVDQTPTHWNNKQQHYLWLFGIATHHHSQPAFHTTTQALWRRTVLS